MTLNPPAQRIDWLDGWRAVAVFIVILSHLGVAYKWKFEAPGKLGVFIFFSISGYIVTKTLLREKNISGTVDVWSFYIRRSARILPPLIIFFIACLALGVAEIGGVIRSITFTCNIAGGPGDCGWIFGHTWSLAFEEQFYLLLPCVLLPRLRLFSIAIIPFAILPFVYPLEFIGRIGFIQIYMLLGLGAAVAIFETRAFRLLSRIPAILGLGFIGLAGCWMYLPPSRLQAIAGILVPFAIVIGMYSLPLRSALIRTILASLPMRTIGLYSYTIYLWQQLALRTPPLIPPPLGLLLALIIAAMSYYTVEKWFRDGVKRQLPHNGHRDIKFKA